MIKGQKEYSKNVVLSLLKWWKIKHTFIKYIYSHIYVRLFVTPWPHGLYMEFSRPETGVGSLTLLQGIFPTQGLNPGLPHCRQILYQLCHKESPRIPAWVAYPFFSESSQPRNWIGASCIAGRFFTNWAFRKALYIHTYTHLFFII